MYVSSIFFMIVTLLLAPALSLDAIPAAVDEIKTNIVKVKQPQSQPQREESMKLRGSREGGQRSNSKGDPSMGHQRNERTNSKIDPSARLPSAKLPEAAGDMDMLAIQKQMRTTQKRTETENKKSFNSESAKQKPDAVPKDLVGGTPATLPKQPSNRRKMTAQPQKESINNDKSVTGKDLKAEKVC
jgi:hypothetical protein